APNRRMVCIEANQEAKGALAERGDMRRRPSKIRYASSGSGVMADYKPDWKRSIPREQRWGGCWTCKHLQTITRCAAFREGIPLAIFGGRADHLVVRPGQTGTLIYEPRVPI